jgi:energy-coupling factor transporter ATP-binding protein EcfA2
MLDEADVTLGLTHVFLAYRLRAAEALEAGTALVDIPKMLGPAPWDVLNETFQVAEFPYQVVSPVGTKLLDPYEIFLEDPAAKQRLRPIDLSSGEKVLLGLVLWLYNSQHHGRFPRLFLLDEPDAHLHPSMTRHLLGVIKEVLVERHNVRTIMTTHSPSTVALAPAQAVFEMSRTKPRILPSTSQAATIGLLTAGLVTVSPSTRYVLVEDEDDVKFYGVVRDILTDYGPSRDPQAINPAPTIVFLPASTGTGKGKVAGGKSVVQGWVDKFDQPPLDELVRGVIDRDTANAATTRVAVLGRYSIENYYLDPFVVFGVLLDARLAPAVANVSISAGDEHRVRSMDAASLQAIVNAIRSAVEPTLASQGAIDTSLRTVTFTNAKSVEYPAWMLDYRGHDLLSVYQSLFGGADVISPPRLERSLRRTRLIPSELAKIFHNLQT